MIALVEALFLNCDESHEIKSKTDLNQNHFLLDSSEGLGIQKDKRETEFWGAVYID